METTAVRTRRWELTPTRYAQLSLASAVSLYLIVLTGAAVRLTGSGLACESWPGCQEGAFFPAVGEHSSIEFGNRVMALFPIGLSLAAWFFAYRTTGLSRWVRWVAAFTFLGTIAQAPLGLLTIRLDPHPLMVAAACGVLVFPGTLSTAAGPHPGDSAEIERFWNLLDAVYIHVRATAAFGICFLLLLVWLHRNRDRAEIG